MSDADNKSKPPAKQAFTLDTEENTGASEMPSVTRLLNRKSLGLKAPPPPAPGKAPPPNFPVSPPVKGPTPQTAAQKEAENPAFDIQPTYQGQPIAPSAPPKATPPAAQKPFNSSGSAQTPGEISIDMSGGNDAFEVESSGRAGASETSEASAIETNEAPAISDSPRPSHSGPQEFEVGDEAPAAPAAARPKATPVAAKPTAIKPAGRRDRKPAAQLITWDHAKLKAGVDPLGKGLAILIDKGALGALFLAITAGPPGAPVPHFVSSAALNPGNYAGLWAGLRWDPTVAPDLWNNFVKTGVAELPPPGTMTNITSARNVVRAAFGLEGGEWLTLIRAGSASACRGVLAVVSNSSLQLALPSALPFITAAPPKSVAA